MADNENFFRRLSRLFRSGPAIQRRVKGYDKNAFFNAKLIQGNYGYRAPAPIGFGRENTPLSVLGSYGLLDRMSRYAEFAEQEYTGEIACLSGDTRIATLEGFFSIKELTEKYGDSKESTFEVWCWDSEKCQYTIGTAHHPRKTGNKPVVELSLDNGTSLICTTDHRILLRDGTYKEAGNLTKDDILMPFEYQKKEYLHIGNPFKTEYKKAHRYVFENIFLEEVGSDNIHHVNSKKYDNRTSNLQRLTADKHLQLHNNSEEIRIERSKNLKTRMRSDKFKKKALKALRDWQQSSEGKAFMSRHATKLNVQRWKNDKAYAVKMAQIFSRHAQEMWKDEEWRAWKKEQHSRTLKLKHANDPTLREKTKHHGSANGSFVSEITNEHVLCEAKKHSTLRSFAENFDFKGRSHKSISQKEQFLRRRLQSAGFKTWKEYKNSEHYCNHRIIKVTHLKETMDVYDLTVDHFENFCLENGLIVSNCALDIYADECVGGDVYGRAFHIYSDNAEIKKSLDELFYDTLNVEFNLRPWIRNLPVKWNTPIPLLSGETITIEELSRRIKNNEHVWVYSVQKDTQKIVPGKVTWCDKTYTAEKIARVYLDDGTFIETAPEHTFILRNGKEKRADELNDGDSLMPFYSYITDNKKQKGTLHGYEKVYNPSTDYYKFTHRAVSEDSLIDKEIAVNGIKTKTHKKQNLTVLNHKVASVKIISEKADVYCMEVLGPKNEHDRHNFAVCGQKTDGTYDRNGVFVSNCKYGDFFLFNEVMPDYGIINTMPIKVDEIEREEGYDPDDPYAVRYKWITRGNIYLENWQIVHFRILGNDLFLPYGTCLDGSSKISTPSGYKEIQHLKKGDEVLSFDFQTQNFVSTRVLDQVCSGEKQLFDIQTRHNKIRASKEHQVLIVDSDTNKFSYTPVSNLTVGDRLVLQKEHLANSSVRIDKTSPIEVNRGYWNSIDRVPDFVTPDLAYLIGFLLGDGWISNNTVYFARGVVEGLNEKIDTLLEQFVGKKVRSTDDRKQGMVGSKMLVTVLGRLGFQGNVYTKRIPEWVYSASANIRHALLAGLMDADGSSHVDKWNCTRNQLELSNEELIRDAKLLVQSLGLKSGQIGSRHRTTDGLLIEGRQIKTTKPSFYFYWFDSSLSQSKKHDTPHRKTDSFVIEPIVSISEGTTEPVYDIYVDHSDHNFVADGVVVHNSILEPTRRVWRQMIMMEDAMLVYRVVRCLHGDTNIWTADGYKKLKNINVGDNVYSYDAKTKQLICSPVTDFVNNGKQRIWQINSKHRSIKANDNHPLLVKNIQSGEESYVLVKNLIPKVHHVIKPSFSNVENPKIEVKLTDEEEEFGFLSPAGGQLFRTSKFETSKAAIERKLVEETKLTFNRIHQFLYQKPGKIKGLPYDMCETICNAFNIPKELVNRYPKTLHSKFKSNLPKYVDEKFARFFGFMIGDGSINKSLHKIMFATSEDEAKNIYYADILKEYAGSSTFHHDKRKKNKHLGTFYSQNYYFANILVSMGFISGAHNKRIPKWVYQSNDSIKEAFLQGLVDADGHTRTQRKTESYEIELCNEDLVNDIKELIHQLGWDVSSKVACRTRPAREIAGNKMLCENTTSYSLYFTKQKTQLYEPILSVELTDEIADVYDIRVDNDLHNFIADGIVVHNSPERRVFYIDVGHLAPNDIPSYMEETKSTLRSHSIIDRTSGRQDFRYNSMSIDEDFFIPVRGDKTGTHIETLAAGQHVTATEDVKYIQSKLFSALKVPKPYLNFDENLSAKATLAQQDVRFSRTINVLQKIVVAELNKLAMIHLFAKGFDGEDLIDFELKLNNPSTVALQQKLELWSTKIDVAGSAKETKLVDEKWIQKHILDLTDTDIANVNTGLIEDKIRETQIEAVTYDENLEQAPTTTDTFDQSNYEMTGKDVPKVPVPKEDDDMEMAKRIRLDHEKRNPDSQKTYKPGESPIKATPYLTQHRKNRSRQLGQRSRTATLNPDFSTMTSAKNRTFSDIYDSEFLRNPLKREAAAEDMFELKLPPPLTREMDSIIKHLKVHIEEKRGEDKKVITEFNLEENDTEIIKESTNETFDIDIEEE